MVILICKNPSGDSILQMDQQQWFIKRLSFERCSECHLRPLIFHQIYHVSPSAFCLWISMDNLKVYLNWIILVILFLIRTVLALKYGQSNWLISMAVATVTLSKFRQMQCRLRGIFCFQGYQLNKKKKNPVTYELSRNFPWISIVCVQTVKLPVLPCWACLLGYCHNAWYSGSDWCFPAGITKHVREINAVYRTGHL